MSNPPPPQVPWPAAPPAASPPPGAYPPPAAFPPPPRRKPTHPEEYHQLLRHGTRAWWRPLVSLLLLGVGFLAAQIVAVVALMIVGVLLGHRDPAGWLAATVGDVAHPLGFLTTNLILASLVPAVWFALWVAHGVGPRVTLSVLGRIRWRWAGWVALVIVPFWAAYLALMWVADGQPRGDRPREWVALVVLCLLTTPLQCLGEEMAFRVWFMQSLGSWFGNRWLALAVPTLLSVPAFALAHGSLDAYVLVDIGLFAVASVLVTWLTGGIEAAVVMHATNNVLLMLQTLLLGGFRDVFVSGDSTASPLDLLKSAGMQTIAVLLIWGLSVLRKPARRGDPEDFRLGARRDRAWLAAQAQQRAAYEAWLRGGGFPQGGPTG